MNIETTAKAAERALRGSQATSAKHVWEKCNGGWKYVISLHGLLCNGVPLIHCKFILWAKEDKSTLLNNSITYLYDLNCVYRTFEFENEDALQQRIEGIVKNAQFGRQLKELSSVMIDGLADVNMAIANGGVRDVRVLSFDYAPTSAIAPCKDTSFRFKLFVNEAKTVFLEVSYEPSAHTWVVCAESDGHLDKQVVENASEIIFVVAKQVTKMLHKI